jgi:hypothetical protein
MGGEVTSPQIAQLPVPPASSWSPSFAQQLIVAPLDSRALPWKLTFSIPKPACKTTVGRAGARPQTIPNAGALTDERRDFDFRLFLIRPRQLTYHDGDPILFEGLIVVGVQQHEANRVVTRLWGIRHPNRRCALLILIITGLP